MKHVTTTLVLALMGPIGCGDDGGATGTGDAAGTNAAGMNAAGMSAAGTGAGGMQADPAPSGGDEYNYAACPVETHVGGFEAALVTPAAEGQPAYSSVGGRVSDGIDPERIPEPLMTVGDCTLMMGRVLFCDPEPVPGMEICGDDGQPIPEPVGQDMGTVDIAGLVDGPASMEPRAPRFNYQATGTLSYPGFEEGAAITLQSSGGAALSLLAEGVAPLAVHGSELPLVDGSPAVIDWDPPAQAGRSRVLATLNISLHGGDPVRVECDTEDDGSLEIAAELISQLLGFQYSGFPAISLTRQTSDSVEGMHGCIDLRVSSSVERHPVAIEGLTSCNSMMPCPAGQSCNDELYCE